MLTVEKTAEFIEFVLNNPAITVIRQKQDKRSPAKPYCAYRFLSNQPFGSPAEYYDDIEPALKETIEEKQRRILEIQFFTKTEQQAIEETIVDYISANDLAELFRINSNRPRSRTFQKQNGFSVLSAGTITDIDEYLGDLWERRAVCELKIHTTKLVTEEVYSYDPETALNFESNIEEL